MAETVAYDLVLEVAMKVQHFQQRHLLLHGEWKWLLEEFATYYGVSNAYTKLRLMILHLQFMECITKLALMSQCQLMIQSPLLSDTFLMSWTLPRLQLIVSLSYMICFILWL